MALALLSRDWVRGRGGSLLALVVDHGLRESSGAEAALTVDRLRACGIAARVLALSGLVHGPALAARARAARYAALAGTCAEAGILHLLLGHHAGDQAETLRMRARAGSGARGLAGMAALVEGPQVRLLRPLLGEPPGRLRALLGAAGVDWVEDPSNRDPATLRARLRAELADPDGEGPEVASLLEEARAHGRERAVQDVALADELAARVRLHPDGWAVLAGGALAGGPLAPDALSALIATIAGRAYPVARGAVAALAAAPHAATLGGARMLPAGRAGPAGAWLVVREEAAMQPPVAAAPGALWDGRFRLAAAARMHPGSTVGALGTEAAAFRRAAPGWPAAVLRTLPALRREGRVLAVPALAWPDDGACDRLPVAFQPAHPLFGAPFLLM